jgi:hypothetical protein
MVWGGVRWNVSLCHFLVLTMYKYLNMQKFCSFSGKVADVVLGYDGIGHYIVTSNFSSILLIHFNLQP